MVNGRNFFDQAVENAEKAYENLKKITTIQRDGYPIECLLDTLYSNEHHKAFAIAVSKQ